MRRKQVTDGAASADSPRKFQGDRRGGQLNTLLDLFPPLKFDLGFDGLGLKWDPVTNRRLCVPCWNTQHYLISGRKGRTKKIRNCLGGGCQCDCVAMLHQGKNKRRS
jgi:hypothetical protein